MAVPCQSGISQADSAPSARPQGVLLLATCLWSIRLMATSSSLLSLSPSRSVLRPLTEVLPSYHFFPIISPSLLLTRQELMGSILYSTLVTQHARGTPTEAALAMVMPVNAALCRRRRDVFRSGELLTRESGWLPPLTFTPLVPNADHNVTITTS